MSRLALTFECGADRLAGTLDTAPGHTGLLIVSGGSEIRSGAFGGQARLAAEVARAGFPVFRFDRRGVGDSEGEDRGFRKSRKDIAAALLAFRAIAPQVDRVAGFGNCDAASALMLAGGAGCDALVLSNPWTIEADESDAPPPAAVRARYAEKLRNPKEIARLLRGGVNLRKLAGGMLRASTSGSPRSDLAEHMRAGVGSFVGPVAILLAGRDRTAQVFADRWPQGDTRVMRCADADHAFSTPDARDWLRARVLEALGD